MTVERKQLKHILREVRNVALAPAIVWVAYLVVAAIFAAATERRGLVSPTDIDLGLILLGAAALGLRMVAIFVLPAVVAFRLAARLLRPRPSGSRELTRRPVTE